MAAQVSQPGVARGRGIGQILQPAGAAAPAYMKSMRESEALAREMESNDQKMMILGKQFEIAQKAGARKEALELAKDIQDLQLKRDDLAERASYHNKYIGAMLQKAGSSSGVQKAYFSGLNAAQNRAARMAEKNWNTVTTQMDLKKQGFNTYDQYYDYLVKKEMSRAVPIYGVTASSEKDDDEG